MNQSFQVVLRLAGAVWTSMRSVRTMRTDERGQGLSEYLILVLLIAVGSIAAARTLGGTVKGKIEMANRHITKVQVD
jgi:Flp pilus assembly pilin Flp